MPDSTRLVDAGAVRSDSPLVDRVFQLLGDLETQIESAVAPTHERPWILCVEDDADLCEVLRLRFEQLGVGVVRAADGRAAYREAFRRPADVILLDYNLPNGNGDYVLRRLKENPVTHEIPVVVLTGRSEKWIERQMLNLGAVAFFQKPADMAALIEELRRHVAMPLAHMLEPADID